jgi:hypothetical protein
MARSGLGLGVMDDTVILRRLLDRADVAAEDA